MKDKQTARALTTRSSNPISPLVPVPVAGSILLALNTLYRNLGINIFGERGSGKTRLLSLIAWQDFLQRIGLVILDPIGACIDYFLGKIMLLPQKLQQKLWKRIIYVDFSGSSGYVVPFPVYVQTGNDSLYTIANRLIGILERQDMALSQAPILGLNAVKQLGIPAGMMLTALGQGFQISELADLVQRPHVWLQRFDHELQANREVAPAVAFFEAFAQMRQAERDRLSSSLLTKLLPLHDPTTKALLGASWPGIDLSAVVDKGLALLLDFRGVVDPELRRFLMLHVFVNYLFAYVKRRGPSRSAPPLSILLDEATQLLTSTSGESPLLADDLDALVNVYMRNTNTYLSVAYQHGWQLSPRLRKSLMSLSTQIVGVSRDPEEALYLARQLFRYDPFKTKKIENVYFGSLGVPHIIDERTIEYAPLEQEIINSHTVMDQPSQHFWLKTAGDGEKVHHLLLTRIDRGLLVDEALVAQARQLLSKRCGVPVETILSEIAGRLQAPPPTSVPPALPHGVESGDKDENDDDLLWDQTHKKTASPKAG